MRLFDDGRLDRLRDAILRALPAVLFVASVCFGSVIYGIVADHFQIFPYPLVKRAVTAGNVVWEHFSDPSPAMNLLDVTAIDANAVRSHRITPVADVSMPERYLLLGGPGQYLEYCPKLGCLAVVLNRDGSLVHVYPYRPRELLQKMISSRPYEQIFYDDEQDIFPVGALQLADGGLIVSFMRRNSFPFSGGIARVAKDGSVLWYRQDYAGHWPAWVGGDEVAITASDVRKGPLRVTIKDGVGFTLICDTMYDDQVEIVDLNGKIRDQFSVLDSLAHSRFREVLTGNVKNCDPLHMNYVSPIGAELSAQVPGTAAGDLLVSLNAISAFGIVGRHDHRFKALIRGSFARQHNVQPIGGTKVIMFDNWGRDAGGEPSRVLELDLATHSERTLFPGPQTPRGIRIFNAFAGHIDVSADAQRAVLALTEMGQGYEFELATGRVLTKFDNVFDMRPVPGFDDGRDKGMARRFQIFGAYYAR